MKREINWRADSAFLDGTEEAFARGLDQGERGLAQQWVHTAAEHHMYGEWQEAQSAAAIAQAFAALVQ